MGIRGCGAFANFVHEVRNLQLCQLGSMSGVGNDAVRGLLSSRFEWGSPRRDPAWQGGGSRVNPRSSGRREVNEGCFAEAD
jgi:hypothetical protein